MKMIFVRHGKTKGNLEHRYVGRTDEELCEIGINFAKEKSEYFELFEEADAIFVSPMKRCLQTMEIFLRGMNLMQETPDTSDIIKLNSLADKPVYVVSDFREYDFGEYEMKNHEQLMEYESYRSWLESNGTYEMPAGEGMKAFKERVVNAFDKTVEICEREKYKNIIYVVHGGTIMSIFEKYDEKKMSYYDYMIKNLENYTVQWKNNLLVGKK